MRNLNRKEIFILFLCLFIGFVLRSYTFDKKSLWLDEIYTFQDSRDDIRGQLNFYKENPSYLQAPLFFILTNQFFPFTKPERDLRIIPLIFGTLSIPIIYLLARSFSPHIAIPCTISLTFMTYHISLSQEGRPYSLLMFLGMTGLYFFMKHLQTSKKYLLFLVAIIFSTLFYTSYSSIPFITLSQILWFYRANEKVKKPTLYPLFTLNGLILLLCLPWILFLVFNYHGQSLMVPYQEKFFFSFWDILSGIFHDWAPHAPLMIVSVTILAFSPFFSTNKKNALLLLAVFIFPIGSLYFYCKLFNITHFVTSRYFISFLPIFLITLYFSLTTIQDKFQKFKKYFRLDLLFVILFVISNLIILPAYYCAEKEDFRSLVNYLKSHLRKGDKLFDVKMAYAPGVLHYFEVYPEGRHYSISYSKIPGKATEFRISFTYKNIEYPIYYSKTCCDQYIADGSRLWIITGNRTAKILKKNSPAVLKGYFDGSFLNFNRFPTDASIYLFLWDPKSPGEKGIDMLID